MFVMVRCTYVSCLFESISLKFARFNTKISFYVNVMNSAIDKQDDLIQKEKNVCWKYRANYRHDFAKWYIAGCMLQADIALQ